MLAGREKHGKSSILGDAACAATRGRDFLGKPTKPGYVVWLSFEESEPDLVARVERFRGDPARIVKAFSPPSPLEGLEAVCKALPVALVIVDSPASLASHLGVKSMWDSAEVTKLLLRLRAIATGPGKPAVIFTHHFLKREDNYRDSSGIGATADVLLLLTKTKLHPRDRTIQATGRIPVENLTYRLAEDGSGHELLDNVVSPDEAAARAKVNAAVLAYVAKKPGSTADEIQQGTRKRREAVRAALSDLQAQRRVGGEQDGRATRYYTLDSDEADEEDGSDA
jgi:hypothetical protein